MFKHGSKKKWGRSPPVPDQVCSVGTKCFGRAEGQYVANVGDRFLLCSLTHHFSY